MNCRDARASACAVHPPLQPAASSRVTVPNLAHRPSWTLLGGPLARASCLQRYMVPTSSLVEAAIEKCSVHRPVDGTCAALGPTPGGKTRERQGRGRTGPTRQDPGQPRQGHPPSRSQKPLLHCHWLPRASHRSLPPAATARRRPLITRPRQIKSTLLLHRTARMQPSTPWLRKDCNPARPPQPTERPSLG